jgi:hypothetical protein
VTDVNALRSFLVASPRPAKILVTSGDGEQQEVLPPKGVGGVTWAGVARTIETLDPASVECFDAEDKLIRAQRFDAQVKDGPELPAVLARDAESARVALFASHIAAAYKFSVETAFTKMVEMFERSDARQERLEARLERVEGAYRRTMQERIDEAFEEAEEAAKQVEAQQADPATAIMQSFMGGAAQGVAQKSTPNGKAGQ